MVKSRRIRDVKRGTKKARGSFTRKDFSSGDGMMTSIWGPAAWHLLHTMSFNYPVHPTCDDKRHYRDFVLDLQYTLPCGKCRENLKKNLATLPLQWKDMRNRATFSKYMYRLHEVVNTMLGKKSGLSYDEVRERYEHFRARCGPEPVKIPAVEESDAVPKKENGCTEPMNQRKKTKCVLKIVPQDKKCPTFQAE